MGIKARGKKKGWQKEMNAKWNEVKDDNVKLLNEKLKLETEIKKNKNFSIMKHFKVVKKKKIKVESKKEDKIKKKEKAITQNEKKLNKKKKVMEEEKKKRLYDRPAQDREEQIPFKFLYSFII